MSSTDDKAIHDIIKTMEQELSTMESHEATGYIAYMDSAGGGLLAINIASPGLIAYHFARKAELRGLITEMLRP